MPVIYKLQKYNWQIYVPSNLRIFSTYLPNVVKNTLWDPTKYIYLESARRDLQNGLKILVKIFS